MARSYIEGFTIHGLSKVFTGRPLERLFWLFALISILGFVSYKVYDLHQLYRSNTFRTEIREFEADNFTFPEIIFCSRQLIEKFSDPCYKGSHLGKEDILCPGNTTIFEAKIEGDESSDDHDPKDENDWGKKVELTAAYFAPHHCAGITVSSMFDGKRKQNTVSKYLYLDMKGLPEYIEDLEKSRLFVSTDGYASSKEIRIGRHIFHILHVKIINRLRAPFKSNCSNGEGDVNVFPGPYTRQKCKSTLLFKELLKYCGAVPDYWRHYVKPHFQKGWVFEDKNRTSENILWCFQKHKHMVDEDDFKKCPLPCKETVFEVNIETEKNYEMKDIKEYEDNPGTPRSEILPRFQVRFGNNKHITEITELAVYTLDDFFSNVGGWLGLLAGVSFLSLVEVVAFIFTTIKEKVQ